MIPAILICKPELCFASPVWIGVHISGDLFVSNPGLSLPGASEKLPFRVLMPQLGATGAVLLSWPKFVNTFKSHLPMFKIDLQHMVQNKQYAGDNLLLPSLLQLL